MASNHGLAVFGRWYASDIDHGVSALYQKSSTNYIILLKMDIPEIIALIAAVVAFISVLYQRQELKNQRHELEKTATANQGAMEALVKQNKLSALSSLLDTEIHLHQFNDKGGVTKDQKKWASDNLKEITDLKKRIKDLLLTVEQESTLQTTTCSKWKPKWKL